MSSSFWNDRYAADTLAYGDAPNDFLAAMADRLPRRGQALDIGAGAIWSIEGENVAMSRDRAAGITRRMDASDEYLTLGGRAAIAAFAPLLQSPWIGFVVRERYNASFDLAAVDAHVRRFRELCPI